MLISLDVDVYGFTPASSFQCCSGAAERLVFQRFPCVEVLYAIVLFLSLGIASGTKSNENPCLRGGVIVPLLLKLNQPPQPLPQRPGECPSTSSIPIHTKLKRLSQLPGVAPTGPRQAPHHHKVASLVLLAPHPTERHRGLILNSGNGSKPSMRIDRVLSHARSSSARWSTGIGLVRVTPSNQPINHQQPCPDLLFSLTAFDLDTVKLLMALFVGLAQAPVLASHHLTYIWSSGHGSQWYNHI